MQWLYRVIGQAGIFLICAQTVVHFRPKESYDKYLKLLLSVMLLLQLLQPVLTMFGGGDGWNAEEQVTGFMQELQTVLTRASEQAEQSQEEIGNTAAAVAQEAGEGYDPANVWEQDSAQGAVEEKTVGKYRNRRKRILFGCIFNLFSCIDADFVQSAVSCVKACIGKSGCRRI